MTDEEMLTDEHLDGLISRLEGAMGKETAPKKFAALQSIRNWAHVMKIGGTSAMERLALSRVIPPGFETKCRFGAE